MVRNYCKIVPCVAFAGVMSLAVSLNTALAEQNTPPSAALFSQLETFHGHVCAGSLFGARLGLAASEALKAAGGTGMFKARYYDLSCPVDGIQVGAGTTFGNKAISVKDHDEHRLVLTATGNRRQVEARLTKKAEEMGRRSRELTAKARALPADSAQRSQHERQIKDIYTWLKTAPTADLVLVTSLPDAKGKNR